MDPIKIALKDGGGCRMEIRRANNEHAASLTKRLTRIFDSCGYHTRTLLDADQVTEGIHLRSHPTNAASALAVQSAFHSAGIEAVLSIDNNLAADVVVLHLGVNAIAEN